MVLFLNDFIKKKYSATLLFILIKSFFLDAACATICD